MNAETASRSQRYLALALAFRLPEAGRPHDLAQAYTRLFLGPGHPIAHPYESVYVEGRLMGDAAAQVAACYAEAGLQVVSTNHELPDHVSIELAFMAYLAAQEERDPITNYQLRITNSRQRRFLREHLARWLPQFCDKIEASDAHHFYCEAAREARRLLEEDEKRLALGDWRTEIAERAVQTERSTIRDTQYAVRKRYPDIRLSVDISGCTLCALCAEMCQPGALTVESTPATLSLAFEPARCNGCRACLRLCPEAAVTIERGRPLPAPPSTPRRMVATALRVVCPECQHPHIAAPWLERLAERLGGGKATRRSLAHCPFCKAASGGERRVTSAAPLVTRHSPLATSHALESSASE